MFAFADSPGSAGAAKLMIGPMFVWFFVTFFAGIALLIFRRWWGIALAFALAVSPPFLAFAGYNLLSGVNVSPSTATPSPPAIPMSVPTGGFRPTVPQVRQPDFQNAIRQATSSPTTAPVEPR
jgi:hypothetical protein